MSTTQGPDRSPESTQVSHGDAVPPSAPQPGTSGGPGAKASGATRSHGTATPTSPGPSPSTPGAKARVDVWLWAVRLFKSRSQATAAVRAGHVRVNDVRAKPATPVTAGDRVVVRGGPRERIVVVSRVLTKRVGAPDAATALIDHSPPPPPRDQMVPLGLRDRGPGRPTKRDRREIDRLRGR